MNETMMCEDCGGTGGINSPAGVADCDSCHGKGTLPLPSAAPRALPCIQLPCPCCGETLASVSLHLATLDDETAANFTCEECTTDFSLADVRGFIAAWTPLLSWLEQIPDVAG